jgi:hypothetical protein
MKNLWVLRLKAANGGKMLAKDARQKMHLGSSLECVDLLAALTIHPTCFKPSMVRRYYSSF